MSDAVQVSLEGDVCVVHVDDGKANALSHAVLDALSDALDTAERDAKAVAIIGRPGKFSAGFDLSVMTAGMAQAQQLLEKGALFGIRVYESPIPVVLGVTGHALAMGGILCCAPDYRVGAEGPYKLGLNEVAIGMPVPAFAVELTRERLDPSWFVRAVQSAEIVSPADAVAAGFLDEVVPLDSVEARAIEVAAQRAATVHPGPFRRTRQVMRGASADRLRDTLRELDEFSVQAP